MKNYFEGIHVLADPRTRTLPLFQRFIWKLYFPIIFKMLRRNIDDLIFEQEISTQSYIFK